MKKYGDLLGNKEYEKSLYGQKLTELLMEIEREKQSKEFDYIWNLFLQRIGIEYDGKVIPKEKLRGLNADLIFNENMAGDLWELLSTKNEISSLKSAWNSFEDFEKNIEYYERKTAVLKDDIWNCISYNLNCDRRHELLKLGAEQRDGELEEGTEYLSRIYNTRIDVLYEDDSFLLPFDFKENAYQDFCFYTWSALLKDKESTNLFRKSKRFNANKTSVDSIVRSFAPDMKHIGIHQRITPCDRWLVEKITGNGLAHSIVSVVGGIDNGILDQYNLEKYIVPLIKELVRCKPIEVRIAISDLVVKYINDVLAKDEISMDIKTNSLLSVTAVNKLGERIKRSVDTINKKFGEIATIFFDFYSKYESDSQDLMETLQKKYFIRGGLIEIVKEEKDEIKEGEDKIIEALLNLGEDAANITHFEQILFINQKGSKRCLPWSSSRKKSYAKDEMTTLFSYIQDLIIQEIHSEYIKEISS